MSRLLAVGDIHGYRAKLSALMDKVQPVQEDKVIFLGDYIDRGTDSPGVINYLIEFAKEFPNTVFLAGNHDHLLVSMLSKLGILPQVEFGNSKKAVQYKSIAEVSPYRKDFSTIFYANGGTSTLTQYKSFEDLPADHVQFFASLKLFHEEMADGKNFFFVHAGIRPGVSLENQTAEDLLWITDWEDDFIKTSGFEDRIIVRGHSYYFDVPGSSPYLINVDSGVYLNPQGDFGKGVLTCCDVVTREFWQA